MKKPAISVFLSILALLPLCKPAPCHQNAGGKDDCARRSVYKQWLDYSILSDAVIGNQRKVEVLLSKPGFSECDLKWIFDSVSKLYAKPEDLRVIVKNSMGNDEKGPWSLYIRQSGSEGFQYRPNGSYKGVKKVILRGVDPFDKEKK